MYFQSCDPFNSKQTTWWMRYEVGTAVVVLAIQFAQPSDCIFILLMFFFFLRTRNFWKWRFQIYPDSRGRSPELSRVSFNYGVEDPTNGTTRRSNLNRSAQTEQSQKDRDCLFVCEIPFPPAKHRNIVVL